MTNTQSHATTHELPEQYLTFMLGREAFGISILTVKEIIEYSNLTEVPLMPAHVRGVINLRGAVVPVVDLAVRFRKPPTEQSRRTCIVILEVRIANECHDIGVMVDAVNSVLDIPASQIEPPPSFRSKAASDPLIHAMGKVDSRFVVLLDANHVLTSEDIDFLSHAAQAA